MKYLFLLITSVLAGVDTFWIEKQLNEMQTHYHPATNFDPKFFNQMINCFNKDGDDLTLSSQNAAWAGMVEYWKAGGDPKDFEGMDDSWGAADKFNERNPVDYLRTEPTVFGNEGMIIYEPCNYVSNVAYYHSVTEICDYDWKTLNSY